MKLIIALVVIEGAVIIWSDTQLFKAKKTITRLVQDNGVMWECIKELKGNENL